MPTKDWFNDAEILDLLLEGQEPMHLCRILETRAANLELGLPAESRLVCRPIVGIVTSEPKSFGTPTGTVIDSSGYRAIISPQIPNGERLTDEDFTADSVIVVNGLTYQIERTPDVKYQAKTMLFCLKLNRTKKQATERNPDPVTNI